MTAQKFPCEICGSPTDGPALLTFSAVNGADEPLGPFCTACRKEPVSWGVDPQVDLQTKRLAEYDRRRRSTMVPLK